MAFEFLFQFMGLVLFVRWVVLTYIAGFVTQNLLGDVKTFTLNENALFVIPN